MFFFGTVLILRSPGLALTGTCGWNIIKAFRFADSDTQISILQILVCRPARRSSGIGLRMSSERQSSETQSAESASGEKSAGEKLARRALAMLKTRVVAMAGTSARMARIPVSGAKLLMTLSRRRKLALFIGIGLVVVLGVLAGRWSSGRRLPDLGIHFIPTVAAHADASWSYDEEGPMEDFYSPIRHPEHVMLFEKLLANLRPSPGSGPNPMGHFGFYIELQSRAAAVEVRDRQGEVLDVIQRTLDGVAYDEIVTPAGKEKLKLVLRKNINAILVKGRAHRIYFKSAIIKP